jgi:hypothetical protein
MRTASALHTFILENVWTILGLTVCLEFPVVERILLDFFENGGIILKLMQENQSYFLGKTASNYTTITWHDGTPPPLHNKLKTKGILSLYLRTGKKSDSPQMYVS